jgi:hypothetical protein
MGFPLEIGGGAGWHMLKNVEKSRKQVLMARGRQTFYNALFKTQIQSRSVCSD